MTFPQQVDAAAKKAESALLVKLADMRAEAAPLSLERLIQLICNMPASEKEYCSVLVTYLDKFDADNDFMFTKNCPESFAHLRDLRPKLMTGEVCDGEVLPWSLGSIVHNLGAAHFARHR